MSVELKPCPFSGGITLTIGEQLPSRTFYIWCACGAEGAGDLNKEAAVEKWNTRPLEARQAARIHELEAMAR